ncbi:hypothetical protein AB0L04_04745 [Streptomyces glaucescens]|uniref:hypothetical protein n=1 Tax=Streptomyces glaucescens TaxID=1907 RepID=UPI00344D3664
MIRPPRALTYASLPLSVLLLTGCGSQGRAADPGEVAARAQRLGIAPEHVYAIEADGFAVAPQSVGVHGDDGFSAVYVSRSTGDQIQLRVDRTGTTAATCPEQPVGASSPGGSATCRKDGDAWYRTSGDQREYAVPKEGHVVLVGAGPGVGRDVLREAALGAHRPTADELDALLPRGGAGTEPVERGDLPAEGDGAPLDGAGAGG